MDDTSTTPADNPTNDDAVADSTTVTDPQAGTDTQPADQGDNLDPSKSTDDSADGDKPTDGEDDAPASTFDKDLDDWIGKKGYPAPETDEQRKAYQDARNEQREFTRTRQAEKAANDAKALGDKIQTAKPTADGDEDEEIDPIEKDVAELKAAAIEERNTRLQSEYITTNNVSTEEVEAMGAILKEMVDKAETPEEKKAEFDYWTNPKRLDRWHKLAKASLGDGGVDTKTVEDEAARKERERIAKESQANSPGRGAKTQTPGKKTPEQERLERFSTW